MEMNMSPQLRLVQGIGFSPHSPIENPALTGEAEGVEGDLEAILAFGKISPHEKMLHAEALLLSKWEFKERWERCLDSPLIAHADAALALKGDYDGVVGIKDAGIPYAKIFEMMGFPVFEIDYSHRKRNMEKPVIDNYQLSQLKERKSVLLADIDFVSGRTLREVTKYLRENGVMVKAAYIGLYKWPGIDGKEFSVGKDTINFDKFWMGKVGGLCYNKFFNISSGKKTKIYDKELIPSDLRLYSPNPYIENNETLGSAAARKIARYFKSLETGDD